MPDSRNFDKFDNDLLSWSYVSFLRLETKHRQLTQFITQGSENEQNFEKKVRCIGTFDRYDPIAHDPDNFASRQEAELIEYIKLCPGGMKTQGLAVKREPGFEVPFLVHGERVNIKNITEKQQHNKDVTFWIPNENTCLQPICSPLSIQQTFLHTYAEQVHRAVDEIAYRLFGFSTMHSFQHRILERVLLGKNILGIAATGGGKSECFILPAMLLPGITIVVSPLKSLMQDQYAQRICKRYGLDHLATFINGMSLSKKGKLA